MKCCPSRAQYSVLTKELGIQKVFLVIGFSMGGQQVDIIDGMERISFSDLDNEGILLACSVPWLCWEASEISLGLPMY